MLPAQRFRVRFLLLKTRLLLFLGFASFAHLLLHLISSDWRICFFLACLLFLFPIALLIKFTEAVLKVIHAGLSPFVSSLVGLFGFFPASESMHCKLLIGYRLAADLAYRSPGLALFEMHIEVLYRYVQVAVLAVLRPQIANRPVSSYLILAEHLVAMAAFAVAVELLLVVLQKVLIVHLTAGSALQDVPAAVSEVRG